MHLAPSRGSAAPTAIAMPRSLRECHHADGSPYVVVVLSYHGETFYYMDAARVHGIQVSLSGTLSFPFYAASSCHMRGELMWCVGNSTQGTTKSATTKSTTKSATIANSRTHRLIERIVMWRQRSCVVQTPLAFGRAPLRGSASERRGWCG